ncbi:MAG: SAM-dependent methyltransferase [Methanothrix sp.]|nr:SAM-dependent methyltransferase [Methanothrix sp.]
MRLDLYLAKGGLAESRSRAVHLIRTGKVRVNGKECRRQSRDVKAQDRVELLESFKYVSRAGYKIEAILRESGIDVRGRAVLDVGCSTGGFSDFFLQGGASRVVGVDLALQCVHPRILADPRFRFFGGVDSRVPDALSSCLGDEQFEIISVDVSRSPLEEVLPGLKRFLRSGGVIIALFKPPYETGRSLSSQVGSEEITEEFDSYASRDFEILRKYISPLRGGAKNRGTVEIFYILRPREVIRLRD